MLPSAGHFTTLAPGPNFWEHLTFSLIGTQQNSLDLATVFPIPFRPGKGHTAIKFNNLSSIATIRIYTVSGERVQELSETDAEIMVFFPYD